MFLRLAATAVLLMSAASPLGAQAGSGPGAFEAMVEAERSFARSARERGIRPAFLEYLAEGSTILNPLPVDARALHEARQETPALLAWRPEVAEMASGGDLGWTTGPWSFHPEGPGSSAVAHGHFVSLWRRQPDGRWRVEVDVGTDHDPAPGGDSLDVERAGGERIAVPSGEAAGARQEVLAADAALAEALVAGAAAMQAGAIASADVRVYRTGSAPARGAPAWSAALEADARPLRDERRGSGVAASGDLGYTFGVLHTSTDAGETPSTSYLRIWRREAPGWRLALDLTLPVPLEANSGSG